MTMDMASEQNQKEPNGTMRQILPLALVAIMVAGQAAAEQPATLGTFGDWTAFAEGSGASKLCYAASAPVKKEGKYTNRGEAAILVTNNLGDRTFDVVSIVAGYDYKQGDAVLAQVDEKKFTMFSKGDRAWNSDATTDKAMVIAMKKGNKVTVVGNSTRGSRTTDVYSLDGFGKAYDAIRKSCPQAGEKVVKRPAKPKSEKKPGVSSEHELRPASGPPPKK
jgi:invasion protein IalB